MEPSMMLPALPAVLTGVAALTGWATALLLGSATAFQLMGDVSAFERSYIPMNVYMIVNTV